MDIWNAYSSGFVVFAFMYVGYLISVKTKFRVPALFVSIILVVILGGTLHLLPEDLVSMTGLLDMFSTFGIGLMMVALGASFEFKQLLKEWKVVLLTAVCFIGIVIVVIAAGIPVFGREYALASIASTGGALSSARITLTAAMEAGRDDIGQLAMLIVSIQIFIGYPLASWSMRRSMKQRITSGAALPMADKSGVPAVSEKKVLIDRLPAKFHTDYLSYAIMFGFAALAVYLSNITGINVNICFLITGIIGRACGIIKKDTLQSAGGYGLCMMSLFALVLSSCVTLDLVSFAALMVPAVGLLLIGSAGTIGFGQLICKVFKIDRGLALALSCTCLIGYPPTQTVVEEACTYLEVEEGYSHEQVAAISEYYMPKSIISGIVAVNIIAMFVGPMLLPYIFG